MIPTWLRGVFEAVGREDVVVGGSIPALLVTGAPGAGKTALAKEIGEQLFHAEEPHAVVDLDELARVRPAIADDDAWWRLVVENLRVMWPNYLRVGIRRVVLAGIVHSATTVEAYRSALPGAQLTVARVHAPLATMEARLRSREPGTQRTFLLDAAPRLDEHIARLGVEDMVIENAADQSIVTLAREVLDQLGWPSP